MGTMFVMLMLITSLLEVIPNSISDGREERKRRKVLVNLF